ncbi:MAG: hypothetical protein HY220_00715 [Candidatus Sungbacteria bacterium]|uniref:Uncharacterized protein n=1 Tax=Candidatus Sungiibacteriota bacterium TaxID=2750080 RepID=A0A9D6LQL3_9BACT|nr:hypothetical protein [Candidatus Sungbacteria bacterium]
MAYPQDEIARLREMLRLDQMSPEELVRFLKLFWEITESKVLERGAEGKDVFNAGLAEWLLTIAVVAIVRSFIDRADKRAIVRTLKASLPAKIWEVCRPLCEPLLSIPGE